MAMPSIIGMLPETDRRLGQLDVAANKVDKEFGRQNSDWTAMESNGTGGGQETKISILRMLSVNFEYHTILFELVFVFV